MPAMRSTNPTTQVVNTRSTKNKNLPSSNGIAGLKLNIPRQEAIAPTKTIVS